jgi:putative inorganic carbon (HCO3(-)) transporter
MNQIDWKQRIPFWLTMATVLGILASTAAYNILIAVAFSALLFSGEKLQLPPIRLPLALFMLGTLISVLLSDDPWSGRPAIRKFYLFLILLLVTSTFRKLNEVRWLIIGLCGMMALSALDGFAQFYRKIGEAQALHRGFYEYYTRERITGFTSHWMTFGGEEMMVILIGAALVFFAPKDRVKPWIAAAVGLLVASLMVGYTRSIWLGTAVGGIYLIWMWKRWWVLALPVLAALTLVLNPFDLGERVRSIFAPHGDTDSNQFRYVCRRTGWEMIKAHPFFGLGPEQVKAQFDKYVPADIPRPLPTGWYGHLHNIYYHYAAERGIPTMLALMWFLGRMLYDFWRGLVRLPKEASLARAVLFGAIAVVVSMLAEGYYENNFGDGEPLALFLAIASCGYLALRESAPTPVITRTYSPGPIDSAAALS